MRRSLTVGALVIINLAVVAVGRVPADSGDHELRFRPVVAELPPEDGTSRDADSGAATAIASCDPAAVLALTSVPTTALSDDDTDACVVLEQHPASDTTTRLFLGPAALTGSHVRRAKAEAVGGGAYAIELSLRKSGVERLNMLAEQLFPEPPPQNQVAMVLDGIVLSAPAFQQTEYEAAVVISGGFTRKQAVSLARGIRTAVSEGGVS